jgi:hypothetical protein
MVAMDNYKNQWPYKWKKALSEKKLGAILGF